MHGLRIVAMPKGETASFSFSLGVTKKKKKKDFGGSGGKTVIHVKICQPGGGGGGVSLHVSLHFGRFSKFWFLIGKGDRLM